MPTLTNPVIGPGATSDTELLRTNISFSEKNFPQVIAQLQDDKAALKSLRTFFREIGLKSCTIHGTEFIGGGKSKKPPHIFETPAGVFWGIDRYRGRILEPVDWTKRLLTPRELMQAVEAHVRRAAPAPTGKQMVEPAAVEEAPPAEPITPPVELPTAITDNTSLQGMLLGLADKLQKRGTILADIQKADKSIAELEAMIAETRGEITKLQNAKIRLVADMAELDKVNAAWTQLQAVLGSKP